MSLEMKDMSKLLETAIVSARLAGQKAMEQMEYAKTSVKYGCELVTDVDSKCQKLIIDRIKEAYPDHGFIGEEGSEGKIFKQAPRGDENIWWVVDPIDGTNNYAHHMPQFCVCIGVLYQNEPVVGVIFDPATDSMFTACKGNDAQLNGRKITVNEDGIDEFSSVSICSHIETPLPNWAIELISQTRYRNYGTAGLHFAYVANGGLAATVHSKVKLWDIAAGTIIAQSAGAIVTDLNGEKIFPFDIASYQGEALQAVASNPKINSELLALVQL